MKEINIFWYCYFKNNVYISNCLYSVVCSCVDKYTRGKRAIVFCWHFVNIWQDLTVIFISNLNKKINNGIFKTDHELKLVEFEKSIS